ncbi:MAG: hypothetical protein MUP81_03285 [Dehalococcoidia bacterium]|nr:hypothetical protein [Dehalococcoidia bacterium]
MPFKFFTNRLWAEKKEPLANIGANVIWMNSSAVKKYNLKTGQLVHLGFDGKTRTVGIKLLRSPTDGAKRLTGKAKLAMQVCAVKFLRHFAITEKGKYPLSYDAKRRILYFPLRMD